MIDGHRFHQPHPSVTRGGNKGLPIYETIGGVAGLVAAGVVAASGAFDPGPIAAASIAFWIGLGLVGLIAGVSAGWALGVLVRAENGAHWSRILFVAPFVAILWVSSYNRVTPELFGFPFFYWYQLAWVVVSAAIAGIVYKAEH